MALITGRSVRVRYRMRCSFGALIIVEVSVWLAAFLVCAAGPAGNVPPAVRIPSARPRLPAATAGPFWNAGNAGMSIGCSRFFVCLGQYRETPGMGHLIFTKIPPLVARVVTGRITSAGDVAALVRSHSLTNKTVG